MKAIVRKRYGPPESLQFVTDAPRPSPGPGEVLVEVAASSLNRADRYHIQGTPRVIRFTTGWLRPKNPGVGSDFAGTVREIGEGVEGFRVGQRVLGEQLLGTTWAEFSAVPAARCAELPDGPSFEAAATLPLAGCTALQGLRDHGRVTEGTRVLMNGATGAVGPLAVQIAKVLGAEVVALCRDVNTEFVAGLGADRVISYESGDYDALQPDFDVFFDIAGNFSLTKSCRVLAPKGRVVQVGGPEDGLFGPIGFFIGRLIGARFCRSKVAIFTGEANPDDLRWLAEHLTSGALRPPIDRVFALEQAAAAVCHHRDAHPQGIVVLRIESD